MVSVIITSFREPKTIGRAIESFLGQETNSRFKISEIIVVAPDEETLDVARKISVKNKAVKIIKDPGKGKPSALNLAIPMAKSDIVVLTDGDVYVDKSAVKNLLSCFDNDTGAVSGKVVATNSPNSLYGYWAYISTKMMDLLRQKEIDFCTGYLYAIRKELYEKIPPSTLADDAYISLMIKGKGKKIAYNPKARVYVLYPANLIDWIRQKKRTAAKFYQLSRSFGVKKEREFLVEIKAGLRALGLIKNPKHLAYLIFLVVMRLYIWARVFFDYRLWRRDFKKTWLRPISTKKIS